MQVSAKLATSAISVLSLPLMHPRFARRVTIVLLARSCPSDAPMATITLRRVLRKCKIVAHARPESTVLRTMASPGYVQLVISAML